MFKVYDEYAAIVSGGEIYGIETADLAAATAKEMTEDRTAKTRRTYFTVPVMVIVGDPVDTISAKLIEELKARFHAR